MVDPQSILIPPPLWREPSIPALRLVYHLLLRFQASGLVLRLANGRTFTCLVFVFGGLRRMGDQSSQPGLGMLFAHSCTVVAQLAMQMAGMQLDDYIPPPKLPISI
jgi:hypothetical protein